MNPKELHQRASEILARVMDLPYEEACQRIEEACGEDQELKKEVLSLFNEIFEEEKGKLADHSSSRTTRRIGKQDSVLRSGIISDWTRELFGNKRNRLILIVFFLVVLLGTGLLSGIYIRNSIIRSEKEEKFALLNTSREILDQWINFEETKINAVASNPEIIAFARDIDSLENLDESYELLKNSEVAVETTRWLRNAASWGNYSVVSFLSNSSPKDLLSSAAVDSTGISLMFNTDLGEKIYTEYLRARNGETVFIPPINDFDLIHDFDFGFGAGVWVSFLCPVKDPDGTVTGIIVGSYPGQGEFSKMLQISRHGLSSETYAFNEEGIMLSASRFTSELRNTYLLDHDSLAETLYRVELKDPGVNIMNGKIPERSQAELPFTDIVRDALNHLEGEDSVFMDAVMKPYRDYRGIQVIGAFLWLPEYGFGLITEEDYKEALITLVYFKRTFVTFYLVILLLSFLLYHSNVRIARIGRKVDDFKLLGQYKLGEKLGEGGFGEVYKAEHTFLKTPVAIKILKSEFTHTDLLDRFEKEVKITSSLTHPNTVRVYDYGTTDQNNFYYVMEYLNGVSLDKVVNSKHKLSVARGIYILYHVCLSLKEAHDKGLVHRDIKPMNIMLCNQGGAYDVVKVLDFGLVKELDASMTQQTQLNRIGGTPMFMAPERIRDPYHADQRVDIYSIGALGLYMFSGHYLLELISQKMLSGQETLQADFRKELLDRTDVPTDLKNLLVDCVHFDPDKRPSGIQVLIDYLESKNLELPWTRRDAMKWWKQYDVYA